MFRDSQPVTHNPLLGHLGHDGKFYILDFARCSPPEAPCPGSQELFFNLLRPEFLSIHKLSLSPDAFSQFSNDDPSMSR